MNTSDMTISLLSRCLGHTSALGFSPAANDRRLGALCITGSALAVVVLDGQLDTAYAEDTWSRFDRNVICFR